MAILNRISSLPTIGYAILPVVVDQFISRIFSNTFLHRDRLIVRSLAGITIWGPVVPRHLKILSAVVTLLYTMIISLPPSQPYDEIG